MPLSRFYIAPIDWNLQSLVLRRDEAHHCRDVLRHQTGDKLIAFNGQGLEATASIDHLSKDEVQLQVLNVVKTDRLQVHLTLAQAIVPGKKMDLILQKATELGVARIVPLMSERSVSRIESGGAQKKGDKWQRVVIEACKQSGQNWMPVVEEAQTVENFFRNAPSEQLCLVASLQSDARHLRLILAEHAELAGRRPESALILVGPEGDFTPAEMATAQRSGCLPWTLGPIVLRSETASIYTLSVLGYELG